MKPLILGVGNILLSDEGVGVRVVQELEKRPEIQPHFDIIDGGTCGMELLDAMANRVCLIGIQPESLESGIGLTETIQNVLPKVFETLNQVIKEYGLTPAI